MTEEAFFDLLYVHPLVFRPELWSLRVGLLVVSPMLLGFNWAIPTGPLTFNLFLELKPVQIATQ